MDVTSKHLSVRPQDAEDFVIESTESSSQGGLSTDGGKILHVMRESGTNDDWRDCRKIPIGLKDRVTDTTSLHYASAYNPAYILSQYGAVLVFPAPSGSSGQYRIYYVNKTPVDNVDGSALAHGDSTIRYFPDDKVYLVVIYAGIKALEAKLSSYTIDEEDSELVVSLQSILQQLRADYNGGFLPDKRQEALMQAATQRRAEG